MLRGAEERLAPILMTALATGLALVPLALAGNKPGHEIEYPMAVVILGGLVTSTVAEPLPAAAALRPVRPPGRRNQRSLTWTFRSTPERPAMTSRAFCFLSDRETL